MKKYKIKINGNPYVVDILDADKNNIKLEVNGTAYEVELESEVKITKTPRLVRAEAMPTQTAKPLQTDKSTKKITAPLPGTVLSVAVKVGDEVKTGDNLLVLEAMKMENNIQADSSGVVKALHVQPNSNVLQGDVLVEIA